MGTGYIYIMTNFTNTALYAGVTSNLTARIWEHKTKINKKSFTSKYKVTKLIYYEDCGSIENAILREKQIKGGSRQKKEELINSINPDWEDLYDKII